MKIIIQLFFFYCCRYPEVVLWESFKEDVAKFQIHDNNIILQYIIKLPQLRRKITNETGVKMAINENVFDPLFQFLDKQRISGSFEPCDPSAFGVIG